MAICAWQKSKTLDACSTHDSQISPCGRCNSAAAVQSNALLIVHPIVQMKE
jgi:hypothetical protein